MIIDHMPVVPKHLNKQTSYQYYNQHIIRRGFALTLWQ